MDLDMLGEYEEAVEIAKVSEYEVGKAIPVVAEWLEGMRADEDGWASIPENEKKKYEAVGVLLTWAVNTTF